MNDALVARMKSGGPKKILACDGGGILGLISVEILAKLEAELRAKLGKPDLVLADWFDFVCGTSTGAIISACVSAGMSMSAIRKFYVDSGADMFDRAFVLRRLRYKYDDEPLALKLRMELNRALGRDPEGPAATLGDPRLRTLLMMVMRNHSTDSPWPVSNNPYAKYNDTNRDDCNLELPLWQLVRASTAAPTFFPPEVVTLGKQKKYDFVFVDGGVTTYNNPAFLAFQMATASPYKVDWRTGTDRLLVVSVGTGSAAKERRDLEAGDLWLLDHAKNIPSALMNAASAGWDMACRVVGECRFGPRIDSELGEMVMAADAKPNWTGPKQFAYVRYDPDVSPKGLGGLGLDASLAGKVQVMDSIEHIQDIQRVGETYAAKCVDLAHMRGFA